MLFKSCPALYQRRNLTEINKMLNSMEKNEYLINILPIPISKFKLSKRARNVLNDGGVVYLLDLVRKQSQRILQRRNCGWKTIKELDDLLNGLDLKFGMKVPQDLVIEIESWINSKFCNEIVDLFKKIYPDKNKFFDEEESFALLGESNKEEVKSKDYLIKLLSVPISEIKLSVRTLHTLEEIKGSSLLDLVRISSEDILQIRNCGVKTIKELEYFLEGLGLRLGMKIPRDLMVEISGYKESKSTQEILDDFKIRYPDKSNFFDKAQLRRMSDKKINRYMECFKLYREGGTLEYVGTKLNLTRERVRQILNKGENYNLYEYETNSKRHFEELLNTFTRERLINEIKILISPKKVCLKLNLSENDFRKLLDYFKIDLNDYRLAARMGKCLNGYSKIVDTLGHHPTTTEMQHNPVWRAIGVRIWRFWGSMEKFREEYGIEKPDYRLHPNTRLGWNKSVEERVLVKKQKKDIVREFIQANGSVAPREIMAKLNLKSAATSIYLSELLSESKIQRIGIGNQSRYMATQN